MNTASLYRSSTKKPKGKKKPGVPSGMPMGMPPGKAKKMKPKKK